MAASLISPQEFERLVRWCEEYHVFAHQPGLAQELRAINTANPTRLDVRLYGTWKARVERFQAFHHEYPFVTAPRERLGQGWLRIAHQFATGTPILLDDAALQRHLLALGSSGSGKTTFAHHIAHQAYEHGLSVVTIDGKSDSNSFPVHYPDTIVLTTTTPLPILEVPPWLSVAEYTALLVRVLAQTLWGGEGLVQVATESLQRTYRDYPHPSLQDMHEVLTGLARKNETYVRRDRIDGLRLRLERLNDRYPGLATTRATQGIPLESLCNQSVYYGFTVHTELEDFLTAYLVELRFTYHRARQHRHLHTLILLDESLLLLHEQTISQQSTIATTFPLLREFGLSVLLTSNQYESLPLAVRANTYATIVMNLTDSKDTHRVSQTLGLNQDQRAYLDHRLTMGHCIIKLGDEWKYPLLGTIPALHRDKTITTTEWKAAVARTLALARNHPLPTIEVQTEPVAPKGPLTRIEHELLAYIRAHEPALISDAITTLKLHPQTATRARKKLVMLGYISIERITTRRGRGGTANALRLTTTGARLLGVPMRQGHTSAQHHYFLNRISQRLPNSTTETSLNGKRIDILITYNPEHHDRVLSRINDLPRLEPGTLVAIEIETSKPSRTAPNNITKNRDVGVVLTIIATTSPITTSDPDVRITNPYDLLEDA